MAIWLRQSTASQEIILGKFVDETDGKTAETALTIANTDIKIWKAGATSEVNKNSGGATHVAAGRYSAVLDATDTDTLGSGEINVDMAGALTVRREFIVLPSMVYDALVLGTDFLQIDVAQFGNTNGTFNSGRPDVNDSAGVTALLSRIPSGIFAGMTSLAQWLGLIAGKQTGNSTARTELRATGAGGGTFDETTDALEAIHDIDGAGVSTLVGRVTAARAGYWDNLNVGGNVSSSAEVTAIQNNTRCVIVVPEVVERPDTGTVEYRVELFLYDTTGAMEAPDSAPTIALVNQAGTDRSGRLDSTTMASVSTGRYRAVYTAAAADALEQLVWIFSIVEGGATRVVGRQSLIVDTTAVDFTAADRAKLETLHDTRLTAGRAAALDNLDVAVSSRLAAASYTAPPSAATNAAAVRTELAPELARVDASVSSRATPAQVNAEVVDALATDSYPEPSAPPAATASLKDKIGWQAALARNKQIADGTTQTMRNDGDTADIATAPLSEVAGATTRGKWTGA